MDRKTIIDGLRMTMDLFVFDPSTGEERDPDELNDLDRTTYNACKGALDILERLDTDSDTISRAKAIEAMGELVSGLTESGYAWFYTDDVYKAIKQLPPAQLSTNLAEVGTDLISRQAAIEAVQNRHMMLSKEKTLLINDLEKLPPAQPKRGRWHYSDGKSATIGLSFGVICDQCGTESEYCTNFCGECGADMREVTT